jgi:hypothetical protein
VLPSLSSDAALRELSRTDDVIKQITGHLPAFSRAPYGSMSARVAGIANRTFVAWSVDTLDWKYPDTERITRSAIGDATNGGIILKHDIHPHTIDAVPGIIDGLRAKGFQLVTLSQLLTGRCGGSELAYGGGGGEGAVPQVSVASSGSRQTTPVATKAAEAASPAPSPPGYHVFDDQGVAGNN